VVNSKFTRSVFQAAFPRVAAREPGILYPPVDVEGFAKFSPSEPRDAHLFVSLNRFERKKNVALAIEALAKVQRTLSADEFKSVKLVVAGGYDPNNSENKEHLHELQQLVAKYPGLDAHVDFRTSVSDLMKKTLLATARAVLYTPSNEHFGIVPVEAMTYGTPVIAVNSGGPLESVAHGETGFLCDSSPDAFADAMLQLLGSGSDAHAEQMGARGRARAREMFSLKTFGDTLQKLVEKLLE
jgi:alpha-1,3/alpha-1,6-mannosyltransferase